MSLKRNKVARLPARPFSNAHHALFFEIWRNVVSRIFEEDLKLSPKILLAVQGFERLVR
jgi:hypothetical protein